MGRSFSVATLRAFRQESSDPDMPHSATAITLLFACLLALAASVALLKGSAFLDA